MVCFWGDVGKDFFHILNLYRLHSEKLNTCIVFSAKLNYRKIFAYLLCTTLIKSTKLCHIEPLKNWQFLNIGHYKLHNSV